MGNLIAVIILVLLLGGAVYYLIRAKKRGVKCVGCPACGGCGGKCESDSSVSKQKLE